MSSDPVVTMTGAAALGAGFPPGVPDTPRNRELFKKIQAEVAAAPPGAVVQVPSEYAETPD